MSDTKGISEKTKGFVEVPGIYISTFETLSVSAGGRHVSLRPRSQEILAYLVTACGRDVPNTELVEKILHCKPDENSLLNMRVQWFYLIEELKAYGIDHIVQRSRNGRCRYADMTAFGSDLQDMLNGNIHITDLYINNYLTRYKWSQEMRYKLRRVAKHNLKRTA